MSRDYRLYLADIIQSCDRISEYVAGYTFATFSANDLLVDAVARNLEIIGEATKNVPANILAMRPEIIWSDVAGFRDVIVHQYFRVKLTVVWDAVSNEIDPIRTAASKILETLPSLELEDKEDGEV